MVVFDATDADLALFVEEAAEHITMLGDGLLRLERHPDDSRALQAVFRAAHTLKGSSATIGHERMVALTHAMESVLDRIRAGVLSPATAGATGVLLAAVDALQVLNADIQNRTESDIPLDALLAGLQNLARPRPVAATGCGRASHGMESTLVNSAPSDGVETFDIEVRIDPASPWPAVRAYQVLLALAPLGTIWHARPSEAELRAGEGGHTLSVTLGTVRGSSTVEQAIRGVSEVVSVGLRPGTVVPAAVVRCEGGSADGAVEGAERRRIDLGPEMRGASTDDQLAEAGARLTAARMVKVDIARLDDLMNLAGRLVTDHDRLLHALAELGEGEGHGPALERVTEIAVDLARTSADLQSQVLRARLLPVASVFGRFPRMVRNLARKTGKSVRFVVEGQELGLDRPVIDAIGDPVLHLLRNAVDHGIERPADRRAAGKPEEATLRLAARHENSQIVIEVADDGHGIDPDKIREVAVRRAVLGARSASRMSDEEVIALIFAPGFSTAEQVTEISGRGVGMDIVRSNIEQINGSVNVATRVGAGTTITIRLPLTLAIVRALVVQAGEDVLTIPLASVRETAWVEGPADTVTRRAVVSVCGKALPAVQLAEVDRRQCGPEPCFRSERFPVVVLHSPRSDIGLVVDQIIGEQEVMIGPAGGPSGADGIAGTAILADGRRSMLVDVPRVAERFAGAMAGRCGEET